MILGMVKVAAATPKLRVADCSYNGDLICRQMEEMEEKHAVIGVFPELCITGYTCGDLFWQSSMLRRAKETLLHIVEESREKQILIGVGLPLEWEGKLYNTAAFIQNGKLLGIVPKKNLPNYSEFYEARHFSPGQEEIKEIQVGEHRVPFGMNLLFSCVNIEGLVVAAEICEDLWVPCPPSISHALAGATVIVNLSASDETTGKDIYRKDLISGQSARLVCGYIYADAGEGESSTDFVYSAHNIIAENGTILKEAKRFQNEMIFADLDLDRLKNERRRMTTYLQKEEVSYYKVEFACDLDYSEKGETDRWVDSAPFVPRRMEDREKRCEEILAIQSMGLKKRLEHTGCTHSVLGISGGLDSTLALLVTVRAFDMLNIPRENIIAVTMPGFGTTDRTYQNALKLIETLGVTLKEISIAQAVNLHFQQIGQNPQVHDITYENSQARQRTLLLMNLANKYNGLVIGTGDMSELALGWATYNGDHMSMYGVNASVPKTLVRHLVTYFAQTCRGSELEKVLLDVLDTPVSPELLPPEDGKISQKTEDLVGPYELHDFYLYYVLRMGYEPEKIYQLCCQAFGERYEKPVILKWLRVFYRRFFAQQFKRSCLPDGPKVGSVAVSPRGDLRMPSDACAREWLEEVERLERCL